MAIDLKARKISVRSADREYTESYDKLVLAPGAKANTFGISGDGVFTLKDVTDTLSTDAYIASKEVTEVLVAGGGFIGTETAENLVKRGVKIAAALFALCLFHAINKPPMPVYPGAYPPPYHHECRCGHHHGDFHKQMPPKMDHKAIKKFKKVDKD